MPSPCSVPFCNNRGGGHKFPRDQIFRQKWIAAIRRDNFVPSEYSVVCKRHFTKEDYKLPKESLFKRPGLVLKKGSVPSVFSWNKCGSGNHKVNESTRTDDSNKRCSVRQCKSITAKKDILHSCPNDEGVRRKWAKVFKVNSDVVENMVICSQHFLETDYIRSKNGEMGVLKHNAVPSQKLPRSTRIVNISKNVLSLEDEQKIMKKLEKMNEVVQATKEEEIVDIRECRACLKKIEDTNSACFIFQSWVPPWNGMASSIAEDLSIIAGVEISETDPHSNTICEPCYQRLLDAATFAAKVRISDNVLRERYASEQDAIDKIWPKPIQVDKNLNGDVYQNLNIEIKQEVVDEEYETIAPDNLYALNRDPDMGDFEIKIEPEDYVEPPSLMISINNPVSLNPSMLDNAAVLNGFDNYEAIISDCVQTTPIVNGVQSTEDDQYVETTVKQEPISEDEDVENIPDLSLECMLCMKLFNSVTGLKAHVIANHSYKSVKRKADKSISPKKKQNNEYRCQICKRSFTTSTDLMVHETCHNKYSCYGCSNKFNTFKQLSKHRKRCKGSKNNTVLKPKTLDDVVRTLKDDKLQKEHSNNSSRDIEINSNNKNCKVVDTDANNVASVDIFDMEIKKEIT